MHVTLVTTCITFFPFLKDKFPRIYNLHFLCIHVQVYKNVDGRPMIMLVRGFACGVRCLIFRLMLGDQAVWAIMQLDAF